MIFWLKLLTNSASLSLMRTQSLLRFLMPTLGGLCQVLIVFFGGRAVLRGEMTIGSFTAFFIYMFASLNNLFYFGLLTGFTILTAFLADVVLAPALMALAIGPRREVAAPKPSPRRIP